MKLKMLYVLLGCLLASGSATAKTVIYSDNLVSDTGLGGSQNYDLDLQTKGIDEVSAVITASSATIPSVTFTDGRVSTGSFTFAALTNLTTAQASNKMTVLSTNSLTGAHLALNGIQITEGVDWNTKTTKALTATDIARAMNVKFSGILLSTAPTGSVIIYSTAVTPGTAANSYSFTSNNSSVTVGAAAFTGGRDAGWVQVGSTKYIFNTDSALGATTATAATNLAAAITANVATTGISAGASGTLVTTTATFVGATGNVGLVSSLPAVVVPSGMAMTGGSAAAFALAGSNIAIPAHGMSTGFGVYLSTPTGFGIKPLVNGTTYYIIKVDAGNVKLATTRANAVAGTPIVFTSSNTPTTSHTFTLGVPAMAGIPSWKWRVSNDGTYWSDLTANQYNVTVSSQTLLTYTYGGATQTWDIGPIGYRYLRLAVIGPTAGPIWIKASVVGKKD